MNYNEQTYHWEREREYIAGLRYVDEVTIQKIADMLGKSKQRINERLYKWRVQHPEVSKGL